MLPGPVLKTMDDAGGSMGLLPRAIFIRGEKGEEALHLLAGSGSLLDSP